jgi:hypothetical protein
MDRQPAYVRLELGHNGARLVTGAREPRYAGSGRDIEHAVRALDYIVGPRERVADRPAMVKRLVRTERSIEGRNRMLLRIWEQDLMHVPQEMGEGGHGLASIESLVAPIGLVVGPSRVAAVELDPAYAVVLESSQIKLSFVLAH